MGVRKVRVDQVDSSRQDTRGGARTDVAIDGEDVTAVHADGALVKRLVDGGLQALCVCGIDCWSWNTK